MKDMIYLSQNSNRSNVQSTVLFTPEPYRNKTGKTEPFDWDCTSKESTSAPDRLAQVPDSSWEELLPDHPCIGVRVISEP